jgi:hypothetical protein
MRHAPNSLAGASQKIFPFCYELLGITLHTSTIKKENAMHDPKELCKKITALYPDIGQCGIAVDVDFDDGKNAWTVDLKKDEHKLRHYLEPGDANDCMNGKQCVALGLEIAQLKKNIKGQQY